MLSLTNLRSNRLRNTRRDEDPDPMATVANIADVMLVFACGLMMALITYWNIDISTATEVIKEDQIYEVQSPEEAERLVASDGTSYINMGEVYLDPTTGKYYMITPSEGSPEAEAAAAAEETATANASEESRDTSNPGDTSGRSE